MPHTQHGKTVYIKGHHGSYVTSMNGEKTVACNCPSSKEWEEFTLEDVGHGKVALKSMGKYLCSMNGEKPIEMVNNCQAWEHFEIVHHPDGRVSFKGNNGKFLSDMNGQQPMMCHCDKADEWEKFRLEEVHSSHHGHRHH